MKCPKCGSENVHFVTETNSQGFSLGSGCCGAILLGPLGLVCVLCVLGSTTYYFCICNNCVNKLTNSDFIEHQRLEDRSKSEQQKKENRAEAERQKREIQIEAWQSLLKECPFEINELDLALKEAEINSKNAREAYSKIEATIKPLKIYRNFSAALLVIFILGIISLLIGWLGSIAFLSKLGKISLIVAILAILVCSMWLDEKLFKKYATEELKAERKKREDIEAQEQLIRKYIEAKNELAKNGPSENDK